jgi:uncharacterized protein
MAYRVRHYSERLQELLKTFPIVCLLGPRQCGKTTFIKQQLTGWRYLDLEKPSDLTRLEADPEDALARWGSQIIFDEAQLFPQLFPILRSYIDEKRTQKGRIVLLGSASFSLIQNISETLAGRVGFLDMAPFHLGEVGEQNKLWFRGGFPEAFLQNNNLKRRDWFESFTRTFITRDLNQLGINVSASQMRRLWGMLAHVHGGLWNASDIAAALGTNYHTVNRYLDILEQTFMVRKLSPYFTNIGKRLVKSPKVYIRDTGILHSFLGCHAQKELEEHPKRGMSWESFVIEQICGQLALHHPGTEVFFWKTATQPEVDLLIKRGPTLIPIEIKLHRSPKKSDLKGLVSCMKDLKIKQGYVVRSEGEPYSLGDGIEVVSLQDMLLSGDIIL